MCTFICKLTVCICDPLWQFTYMLDIIEKALDREGVRTVRLDGSMSKKARDVSLKAFRSDPTVHVFLMSLNAGSLGLNLTQACVAILVDPWWNPVGATCVPRLQSRPETSHVLCQAVENQAINRVHRLGQTRRVLVKRLLCPNTVEDTMLELQAKKQAMADSALSSGGIGEKQAMTLDDLKRFFR